MRLVRVSLAWLTYLYMCSGSVLGFFALVQISMHEIRTAFFLIFLYTMIDYTDGSIGRALDVYKALPELDSWKLDGVIDFVNLSLVPTYILWTYKLLPDPHIFWAALIILSSLYRFGLRTEPLFEKGFYTGLPVSWIFLAFYEFFLEIPTLLTMALILAMVIASFSRIKFLHIARFEHHRTANAAPLFAWWSLYLIITQGVTEGPWVRLCASLSLAYPAFYAVTSLYLYKKYVRSKDESCSIIQNTARH